jgi:hypothetical protein
MGRIESATKSEKLKAKEQLKVLIDEKFKKLFGLTLDYAEVAIDGKDRYSNFRSKVLSLGNDLLRDIKKELDGHYEMVYVDTVEQIIVIKQ